VLSCGGRISERALCTTPPDIWRTHRFVAVIRRRLGNREDRLFATVFFGSGIAYVAVWLVGAAVLAGPAIAMTMLDAAEVTPASASLAGGVAAALVGRGPADHPG
jgi:hypothetical protein